MKSLSLTALLSVFVLFSCNKKDNPAPDVPVVPNVFTYDSVNYTIDQGYLVTEHDAVNNADYGVIRLSSRKLSELNGGSTAVTHMLDIKYSTTVVAPGTYTFKEMGTAGFNAGSNFFYGTAILNLFTSNSIGLQTIAPSTVIVSKKGAEYTITYNLTVRDNKKLTGTFVGVLAVE